MFQRIKYYISKSSTDMQIVALQNKYFEVKVLEFQRDVPSMTRMIISAGSLVKVQEYIADELLMNWKSNKCGEFKYCNKGVYHYSKLTVKLKSIRELSPMLAKLVIDEKLLNVIQL